MGQSDHGKMNESKTEEAGFWNRNTGPDTVMISDEALQMFFVFSDDGGSGAERAGAAQALDEQAGINALLGQQSEAAQKDKKMSNAELLMFLQSDNFADEAMGYVKSVAAANMAGEDDSDDLADVFLKNDEQAESTDGKAKSSGAALVEAADEEGSDDGIIVPGQRPGKTFVNGKFSTEAELKAKIVEVKEEIKALTEAYELVMGGDNDFEEKIRLSAPIKKNLDEKLHELMALTAQERKLGLEKMLQA
jgi:hypothetical protein